MFDVPQSEDGVRGIAAYRKTWPPFFTWQRQVHRSRSSRSTWAPGGRGLCVRCRAAASSSATPATGSGWQSDCSGTATAGLSPMNTTRSSDTTWPKEPIVRRIRNSHDMSLDGLIELIEAWHFDYIDDELAML
jgi:hypothetical protein